MDENDGTAEVHGAIFPNDLDQEQSDPSTRYLTKEEKWRREVSTTSFAMLASKDSARYALRRSRGIVEQARLALELVTDQAVFALDYQELPPQEIADQLSLSVDEVQRRLQGGHRAVSLKVAALDLLQEAWAGSASGEWLNWVHSEEWVRAT